MEVIFIKDLKNQGKKGEIKKVADGYAKNYLIKNGYAVIKNKDNLQRLQTDKKKKAQQELELKSKAEKLKIEMDKLVLEFKVKTGAGDKVFGSINSKQIREELTKKGYNIDKTQIIINNPISALGFHEVTIELYQSITAKIKIHLIK